MKRTKYTLILLGCSVIWGSAFVAQSAAMKLGMLPYAFTAVRMLMGAVCLMPFIYLRRKTAIPAMKRFVKCFFVFIDIFIILEYDLYNKSYFGGE